MKKTLFSVFITLLLVISMVSSSTSEKVSANSVGSCSITIDANKHGEKTGQLVYGTGDCKGNQAMYGFYDSGSFWVQSDALEQVKNGQVLKKRYVTAVGYVDIHVTTIPLKKPEPKPEPKPKPQPEPKPTPTPTPDPKPKPKPKPDPKPTPKPKDPPKPTTPKPSKPKPSTSKPSTSSNTATTSSTQKKQAESKPPTPQEVKSWTVKDLKENNAKVEEKAGKLFATVDGVSKEITEEEAKELGHEVEEQEEELANEETEVDVEEEGEKEPKKKRSFTPIFIGILVLGILTLGILAYFYYKRKNE